MSKDKDIKPGDVFVEDGVHLVAVEQGGCTGCALIDTDCAYRQCSSGANTIGIPLIFMRIEDAVTHKLTGAIQHDNCN